jgi:hypothetical protein
MIANSRRAANKLILICSSNVNLKGSIATRLCQGMAMTTLTMQDDKATDVATSSDPSLNTLISITEWDWLRMDPNESRRNRA